MRTNIEILFVIVAAAFVSGCATPYQPDGFTGGYSDTQLQPDVFRVYFRGNGYTSGQRAQDFAMLRAAGICLQHGFGYFALLNERNSTSTQTVTTPGYASTTGSASGYGNSATYSGSTYYSPGQTVTIDKPHASLMIRCFKTKPKGTHAFDATFLQKSLKQKYDIK